MKCKWPGCDSTAITESGWCDNHWSPSVFPAQEKDPSGKSPHELGAKLDDGKPPVFRGLLSYFPRACRAVAHVSEVGAKKYAWKGWEKVPNGVDRYTDALSRHLLSLGTDGEIDSDTKLFHRAQIAWNALAALELFLKELENAENKLEPFRLSHSHVGTGYCPTCDEFYGKCGDGYPDKEGA